MLINYCILDHVCSCFLIKPFVDLSTFALKSEHVRFLQDFIVWPECLETETTKTEKACDRNGRTETAGPNRPDHNGQTEKWRTLLD